MSEKRNCVICGATENISSFYKYHICKQCRVYMKDIPKNTPPQLNSIIQEILNDAKLKGETPRVILRERLINLRNDLETHIHNLE